MEGMEVEIIEKAGLSKSQAKTYLALVREGAMAPTKIAGITGETRTNTYQVLDKLGKIGLVVKAEGKKTVYQATNPTNLEIYAERRRRAMAKNEQLVKANINGLVDMFYAANEMPGARTLMGVEGIKAVYMEEFKVNRDVYLLRSLHDVDLGADWWRNYRNNIAKAGFKTYGLTQDTPGARDNAKSGRDAEVKFCRVWMPKDAYMVPVAVQSFGGKTAFIAFGDTQMATIIDSPVIAEAVKVMIMTMMDFWREHYPQDLRGLRG